MFVDQYSIPDERMLAESLRSNPIFQPCSDEDIAALCGCALVREGRRGELIAQAGTPFPYLGYVVQGVIGVTASPQGEIRGGVRNLRLYEAYPNTTFCEISFLDAYDALGEIAVVSKHAFYALFPSAAVMQLGQNDPALLMRLAILAAGRCRELKRRLVAQASNSVLQRVAGVLTPFATQGDGLLPVDPQLVEFAQRDIAAAAGCVKEAAARAIAELENVGALRRERGRIRYIDRAKLLQYAELSGA